MAYTVMKLCVKKSLKWIFNIVFNSFQYVRRADYKRPKRDCAYCGKPQTHLKRHLKTKHAGEEAVKNACALTDPALQAEAFEEIKATPMFSHNRKVFSGVLDAPLQVQYRMGDKEIKEEDMKLCTGCRSLYSRKTIHEHKRNCKKHSVQDSSSISSLSLDMMKLVSQKKTETSSTNIGVRQESTNELGMTSYEVDVLANITKDEAGLLCCSDSALRLYGEYLWRKSTSQNVNPIRSDLRVLAYVILECQKIRPAFDGVQLFLSTNYMFVSDCICQACGNTDSTKCKTVSALKLAAKVMRSAYLMKDKLEEATTVENFEHVLKVESRALTSKARYNLECAGQERLRQPKALPEEGAVKAIKKYVSAEIKKYSKVSAVKDVHTYNHLRTVLVTRLTLFNARRGNEPARMTTKDWDLAWGDAWVDKRRTEKLDDLEKALVDTFKLAYMRGKKRKLVPVLILKDCIAGVKVLLELRHSIGGVSKNNKYLFAAGRNSMDHILGSQAISKVCEAVDVVNVTATGMRHRASTLYALEDLPEGKREAFYRHMGHDEAINRDVYQTPFGLPELLEVGLFLRTIDGSDDGEYN